MDSDVLTPDRSPAAPPPTVSARETALGAGTVGLLLALLFWSVARLPLERDEGEYAWAADLLARGSLPYRDTFLQKPPGVVLVYWAVFGLFGPSTVALRAALTLTYLATAYLLYRLGYGIGGPRCGLAAALVFALSLLSPLYETNALNTEALMILPLTGALLCLWGLRERAADWPVVGAGLLFGLAIFFKQVAVFHGLHLAVSLLILGRGWPERLRWLVLFGAASALPYGCALAWFAAQGALEPFLDGVLLHNLEYISGSLEGHGGQMFWQRLAAFSLFDRVVWLAAAGALAVVLARRQWWLAWFLGGWWVAAWLGVRSGGHYRGHYFLQALPPVCLLAGLLLSWSRNFPGWLVAPTLVVFWGVTCPVGLWLIAADAERQCLARYETRRFLNAALVGDWLRQSGGRSLFVLASEPEIYHDSGLRGVSRYVIMNPLFGGFASSRRRQQEVFNALQLDPPDYIVIATPPLSIPMFPESDRYLYDTVIALVRDHYQIAARTYHDRVGLTEARAPDPPGGPAVDLTVYRRAD